VHVGVSQTGDAVVRAESRAHRPRPPGLVASAAVGGLALVVVAVSAWLATRAEAKTAQADVVRWFNQPPQPFAAIFAAVNPLFRPVPLTVLAIVLAGWVLLAAGDLPQRLEVARALALSLLIAEVLAQVMKRIASQPRPTALIPGLDVHGYPTDPWGNAYPSAHTALVVAAVCALWPWMRWPARVAGTALALLVPLNRIYIGAHWPIDLVGGAAIGVFSAAVCWAVAGRWPFYRPDAVAPV
jgi:membrane-associated phospholipid phosphatase